MNSTQQRGYDDQMAGKTDEALMNADTAEGREYRDGKRRARWAQQDAAEVRADGELKEARVVLANALRIPPRLMFGDDQLPPPVDFAPPAPSAPNSVPEPVAPNAFFDPPPKRAKKAKPADDAQLGLF